MVKKMFNECSCQVRFYWLQDLCLLALWKRSIFPLCSCPIIFAKSNFACSTLYFFCAIFALQHWVLFAFEIRQGLLVEFQGAKNYVALVAFKFIIFSCWKTFLCALCTDEISSVVFKTTSMMFKYVFAPMLWIEKFYGICCIHDCWVSTAKSNFDWRNRRRRAYHCNQSVRIGFLFHR